MRSKARLAALECSKGQAGQSWAERRRAEIEAQAAARGCRVHWLNDFGGYREIPLPGTAAADEAAAILDILAGNLPEDQLAELMAYQVDTLTREGIIE